MTQISLSPDRTVRQWGTALGELDDCTIEEVGDETLAAVLAALPGHGGGVVLSEDHQTITPNPEPAYVGERRAAAAQRAADIALLAASEDPHHQALARLLAGG